MTLSDAEHRRIVVEWNDTARDYPRDLCVHHLFEAQVQRTPQAIAVVDGDRRLSYAELNACSNRLAHRLRELGVGPDVRVGLCLDRRVEMVVGLMATLKAGGCYVPLAPDYPVERLREMLHDSAPRVVLVDATGAQVVARANAQGGDPVETLDLAADVGTSAQAPAVNVASAPGAARHLAYVIYTSGSTGRPKGVMNEHHAVVNRLLWMQEAYALTERDVVLQKTPFSFDVSVWEFFWPLMTGAQLVMAQPDGHKNPLYLGELIRRTGVTTLHFVPSMLQLFLSHKDSASCTSIVRVVCSGEALPAALAHRFYARLPGARLYNLYGPTEAAVDVTSWACVAGDARTSIPIGRPIANTQIYIVDEQLQPVAVGVTGEIYIGGVQVARGYLNRPELTAERFIKDPFVAGERLYKTGDLGRWLADGTIEYLGRNDFQVKIRGFRIELGEIEAQLGDHPSVREAVVLVHGETSSAQRLIAHVVGRDGPPDASVLKAYLQGKVPEYMVPAAFVPHEALPLTPNGKIDRNALAAVGRGIRGRV